MVQFKPASKQAARLRMALAGPAGSGKTYTALSIATALGQPVAVVDTEHGSASKYSDVFQFDTLELDSFHPERYIEAIHAAEEAGFPVLIIDSLSHAWMGKDGALELVDRAAKRSQSGNSYVAWRDVTPLHNALVEAMIQSKLHLIVTLRSKQDYVQEKDEKTGKTVIRKIGLAPVQRDGLEYEFDVYGDLDQDNNLIIGKTRCSVLTGQVIRRPGKPLAETLRGWLGSGPVEPAPQPSAPPPLPVMVTSVNDKPYQAYAELVERAATVEVDYETISVPIAEDELRRIYKDLLVQVKRAEKASEAVPV